MKYGFLAPAGTLEKKPPHGAPCNRCGLCCVATVCPLGQHVFKTGEAGLCPGLQSDAGGAVCGLIADPGRYAPGLTVVHGVKAMREAAVNLIAAGVGCNARVNGEPGDEAFYTKLRNIERAGRREARKAKATWGVR